MSIDYCHKCDKRLDTDFIEYQENGALYCARCFDDLEEQEQEQTNLAPTSLLRPTQ